MGKWGREWWVGGERHRIGGPAIEYANGTLVWFKHDKKHRLDGPAVIVHDGGTAWYKEGELHRLDGPAAEGSDGTRLWSVEGKQINEEHFNEIYLPLKPIQVCIRSMRKKYLGTAGSSLRRL